ncbi:hypothetical protein [uncultured Christiangramia sp.]|uniref:hypothetical protein n=1 Tax=uncultured Christiangramia sp. TaxID=503836 RepID=UPI002622278F|nr:hypothetical protein [uncultured Christiangramia sp.]
MSNVLKKITVGNPLVNFGLWEDLEEYKKIQTPEELCNFYHKMLTKYEKRKLVYYYITVMIGFSVNTDVNAAIPNKL